MREKERDGRPEKKEKEFEEMMLEVRRVTRVTSGGRQLSFRAIILVGNKKGKIGLGIAKGSDVTIAVSKATHEAYKNIVDVPMNENKTVPYPVVVKYKAALIKLLPAKPGTGLKAGSSLRSVLELAGYSNMLSKMIGTNNTLNNALATIRALRSYKNFGQQPKQMEEEKVVEKSKRTFEEPATEKTSKPVAAKTVPTEKKSPVKAPSKEMMTEAKPAKKPAAPKAKPTAAKPSEKKPAAKK